MTDAEPSLNATRFAPRRIVVMGVSGCGKSAIGRLLATTMNVEFIEGDDLHSPASIAKMAHGIALDDADRAPWLVRLQEILRAARTGDRSLVIACSALKRRYRDVLRIADPALWFLHLDGTPELIAQRLQARHGHFMPATLLASQLRDLQPLMSDEDGLRVDIANTPQQVVEEVVARVARR